MAWSRSRCSARSRTRHLATWAPARARPGSFFGRFRAVPSAPYANAIVVLYAVSTLLGGILYLDFRVDIRPDLERAGHW